MEPIMEYKMKMPDLATTGSAMTLLKWLVEPGAAVQRGQMLLEVETDKACMEVESTATGTLREVRFHPGDPVSAGEIVAIIETSEVAASPAHSPTPKPTKSGGMFARNREAAAPPVTASTVTTTSAVPVPLSVARRAAGRRLQQSKQSIPHFYLQTSANAGAMIARRKAALPEKLVWDAFFVHAASRVLLEFEQLTYRFEDETLLPANSTAIGVAADIEGDLYVMPVEGAAQKSAEEISREIRAAADALRRNEPGSRKNQPGLLTITNLGSADIETFTAIINPPEAAILAIGKIRPVVVARGEGFAVEQRVNLTLSVDHRIVSGKYAAEFLGALVSKIENL
jgi:pyruvate dehydrogenase E2 component (dihydrolipoamide acetyltransferase)